MPTQILSTLGWRNGDNKRPVATQHRVTIRDVEIHSLTNHTGEKSCDQIPFPATNTTPTVGISTAKVTADPEAESMAPSSAHSTAEEAIPMLRTLNSIPTTG